MCWCLKAARLSDNCTPLGRFRMLPLVKWSCIVNYYFCETSSVKNYQLCLACDCLVTCLTGKVMPHDKESQNRTLVKLPTLAKKHGLTIALTMCITAKYVRSVCSQAFNNSQQSRQTTLQWLNEAEDNSRNWLQTTLLTTITNYSHLTHVHVWCHGPKLIHLFTVVSAWV